MCLKGDDSCNSFGVYGRVVDVIMSEQGITEGNNASSNKVKINPVVKYDWEHKYYYGNLVAVHREGFFIAYSLKGKPSGIVRVINRKSAERLLIKGCIGDVKDLSFAHISAVVLGVVDEKGNMFIYEIRDAESGKIEQIPLLQVNRPAGSPPAEIRRLIWCPYLPDNEDSSGTTLDEGSTDDASKLLVLTHDELAEMWNVDRVAKYSGKGPLLPNEVTEGLVTVKAHSKAILDATFSPDGSALATAGLDGDVKFFQACMEDVEAPRCLHQWQPHKGKPVNFLAFLDDHRNPSLDVQFWKYAVTGGDMNTEICVWSCESWTCLQSLSFRVPPTIPATLKYQPTLKAVLDLTAKYIIMTDVQQKVLYVLQLHQDEEANTALVCSVSEFMLSQPCLSFDILEAGCRKLHKSQDHQEEHLGDLTSGEIHESGEEEEVDAVNHKGPDVGVLLKMCCVHTKALQELHIRFKPESLVPQPPAPSVSSASQDDVGVRDGLSDLSLDVTASDAGETQSDLSHQSENTHQTGLYYPNNKSTQNIEPKPLLLTPDAFTASSPRSSGSSFTHVTAMNDDLMTPRDSTSKPHESPGSSVTITPASSHDLSYSQHTPGRIAEMSLTSPVKSDSINMYNTHAVTSSPVRPRDGSAVDTSADVGAGASVSPATGLNRRTTLQSTGSSSSTSLEVSEILGEVSKQQQGQLFEDDQDIEEQGIANIANTDQGEINSVQEGELVNLSEELDTETNTEKVEWPKAPVVSEVDSEARRLAQEVLDKACTMHMQGDSLTQESMEELEEEPVKVEDDGTQDDITTSEQQIESSDDAVIIPDAVPAIAPSIDRDAVYKLTAAVEDLMRQVQRQQEVFTTVCVGQNAQSEGISRLNDRIDMLEETLTSRVADAVNRQAQTESHQWKAALSEKNVQDKQNQDKFVSALQQSLDASVAQKLDKSVRYEMKNTVIPNVTAVLQPLKDEILQPLKDQLHFEMAQKLTATDALMKENIAKMVRSKHTVESIGQAAASAVQSSMQASYRDAFQTIFVPAFDRACQTLFHQVNDTFVKGTKDFIQQLDNHIQQSRQRDEERKDPVVKQLHSAVENFKRASDDIQNSIVTTVKHEMNTQVHTYIAGLQDNLSAQVKSIVKQELSTALKEQQAVIGESVMVAMRSGAATPRATPVLTTPLLDTREMHQAHLLQLLKQGQLNAAFQEALSASNLEMVMFVCENVNPAKVFNQVPSPLQQPVLLSLIQQLSADLKSNTELKHKFLEEAVMNLDMNNELTRGHLATVVGGLCQKLLAFVHSEPNHKMTRHMKMLLMAAQSLLK